MCRGEEGGRPEKGAEPDEARRERLGRSGGGANCIRPGAARSAPLAVPMWRPPRQGQSQHCACPADFKPSLETAALATAHARWPPRGAEPGPPGPAGRGRREGFGKASPPPAR